MISTSTGHPFKPHQTALYHDQLIEKQVCKNSGALLPSFPYNHLPYLRGDEHDPFYALAQHFMPLIFNALHQTYFSLVDFHYMGSSLFKDFRKSYWDRCDKAIGVDPLPTPFHKFILTPKTDTDLRVWLTPVIKASRKDCIKMLQHLRMKISEMLGSSCSNSSEIFFDDNLFILFKLENGAHPVDLSFVIQLKRCSLFVHDDLCLSLYPYFYSKSPKQLAPSGIKQGGWQAYIDRRAGILRISKIETINKKGWLAYVAAISSGAIPKKDYSAALIANLKKLPPNTTCFPSDRILLIEELFARFRSHEKCRFEQGHLILNTVLMTPLEATDVPFILKPYISPSSSVEQGFQETALQLLYHQQISPQELVALLTLSAFINLSFTPYAAPKMISELSLCPIRGPKTVPHFQMSVCEAETVRSFYFPFSVDAAIKNLTSTTLFRAQNLLPHLFSDAYTQLTPLGRTINDSLSQEARSDLLEVAKTHMNHENPSLGVIGMTLLRFLAYHDNDKNVCKLLFDLHYLNPTLNLHFDDDLVSAYKRYQFEKFLETNPPLDELIRELKKRYWELSPALLFDTIAKAPEHTQKSLNVLRKLSQSDQAMEQRYQELFLKYSPPPIEQNNAQEAQMSAPPEMAPKKILTEKQLWEAQTSALERDPCSLSPREFDLWLLNSTKFKHNPELLFKIITHYLINSSTIPQETFDVLSSIFPTLFASVSARKKPLEILALWESIPIHTLRKTIPAKSLLPTFQTLTKTKSSPARVSEIDALAKELFPEISVSAYIDFLINNGPSGMQLAGYWMNKMAEKPPLMTAAFIRKCINQITKCGWSPQEQSLIAQKFLESYLENRSEKSTDLFIPFLYMLYNGEITAKSITYTLQILTRATGIIAKEDTKTYLLKLLGIASPEQVIQTLKFLKSTYPEEDPFKGAPGAVITAIKLWGKQEPEALLNFLNITQEPMSPLYLHLLTHETGLIKKLIRLTRFPLKLRLIQDLLKISPQQGDLTWFPELLETRSYTTAQELINIFPVQNTIWERRTLIPLLDQNAALQQLNAVVTALGTKTPEDTDLLLRILHTQNQETPSVKAHRALYNLVLTLQPSVLSAWLFLFENFNGEYTYDEVRIAWYTFQELFSPASELENYTSYFLPVLEQYVKIECLPIKTAFTMLSSCASERLTTRELRILENLTLQCRTPEIITTSLYPYLIRNLFKLSFVKNHTLVMNLLNLNDILINQFVVKLAEAMVVQPVLHNEAMGILKLLNESSQILPAEKMRRLYEHPSIPPKYAVDRTEQLCQQLHQHRSVDTDNDQLQLMFAINNCIEVMEKLKLFGNEKLNTLVMNELLFIILQDNQTNITKDFLEHILKIWGECKSLNTDALYHFISALLIFMKQNTPQKINIQLSTLFLAIELYITLKKSVKEKETLKLILDVGALHTREVNTNKAFTQFCGEQMQALIEHKKIDTKSPLFFKALISIRDYKKILHYFPCLTDKLAGVLSAYCSEIPLDQLDTWYLIIFSLQNSILLKSKRDLIAELYINRISATVKGHRDFEVMIAAFTLLCSAFKDLDYTDLTIITVYFSALIDAYTHIYAADKNKKGMGRIGSLIAVILDCLNNCLGKELEQCGSIYFTTVSRVLHHVKNYLANNPEVTAEDYTNYYSVLTMLVFTQFKSALTAEQDKICEKNRALFYTIPPKGAATASSSQEQASSSVSPSLSKEFSLFLKFG